MDKETKTTLFKIAKYVEIERKLSNKKLSKILIATDLPLIILSVFCSIGVKNNWLFTILSKDICNGISHFTIGFTVVTIFTYIMLNSKSQK